MPHYQILDAARIGFKMQQVQELNLAFDSLYRGDSQELLAGIAPYLFQYEIGSEFDIALKENYGDSWGIGIISNVPMAALHKHFRKFLLVKDETGKELYFRFYDPRVLRVFLPSCDAIQLIEFFGPVQQFIVEDPEHQRMLLFEQKDGRLLTGVQEFVPIET
ncbi:hypothetical protein GCM10028807_60630 [Spirosoma daeguense]